MELGPIGSSPYKGLAPYAVEDAPFFFGRQQESEIIAANLLASRLTLLYGPSGVGKSSVLAAGVVSHLRRLAQRDAERRGNPEFVVFTFNSWRDDPTTALSGAIAAAVSGASPDKGAREPAKATTPTSLTSVLRSAAEQLGGDVLV